MPLHKLKMFTCHRPLYVKAWPGFANITGSNRSAGMHTLAVDFTACSAARIDFIDDHVVYIFLITYFCNVFITIARPNQGVIGRARFGTEEPGFFEHEYQVT